MNGPLLFSLLPPERIWDSAAPASGAAPYVAILLLIGLFLSFLSRPPGR